MNVYGTNYLTRLLIRKCLNFAWVWSPCLRLVIESSAQKKDKRYACLLYCISTTLSFKFLLCLVARFKALSNSSLRTNNEYICIFLSFSFHCLSLFVWRCGGCCRSLPQKVWGERCLSHVIVHSHPHTHCSHCCK